MDSDEILTYISQFSILIPITLFLSERSNFKRNGLRILGILLGVSAISDLAGFITLRLYHLSNNAINNFYIFFQFILLSLMYWEFYEKENKSFIKICLIIFVSLFLINTLFIQSLFEFQNITLSVSSVIMIIIAYRFFRFLQNLPTVITKRLTAGRDVHFKTFYFINVAVFLYFVLNLWLFTLNPIVLEIFNEEADFNIWTIHNVMNIVKNCLFAIGLYWAGRKELV